jgi:hypothetical protein
MRLSAIGLMLALAIFVAPLAAETQPAETVQGPQNFDSAFAAAHKGYA